MQVRNGFKTIVTQENIDTLCDSVVMGMTVREACELEGMPSPNAIYLAVSRNEDWANQYARAREAQLVKWEDDIVEISDNGTNDWMERNGVASVNGEHIQRSKLRVDTRKWVMAKRRPKKYGDRVSQEISGPDGQPIQSQMVNADFSKLTDEELEFLQRIQEKLSGG